jgi:hypothetical protein
MTIQQLGLGRSTAIRTWHVGIMSVKLGGYSGPVSCRRYFCTASFALQPCQQTESSGAGPSIYGERTGHPVSEGAR